MLIGFDGKGCSFCCFYRTNKKDWHSCWLNKKYEFGDLQILINDGRDLFIGPTPTEWPKGCPFGEHHGTLQVTARDGTC